MYVSFSSARRSNVSGSRDDRPIVTRCPFPNEESLSSLARRTTARDSRTRRGKKKREGVKAEKNGRDGPESPSRRLAHPELRAAELVHSDRLVLHTDTFNIHRRIGSRAKLPSRGTLRAHLTTRTAHTPLKIAFLALGIAAPSPSLARQTTHADSRTTLRCTHATMRLKAEPHTTTPRGDPRGRGEGRAQPAGGAWHPLRATRTSHSSRPSPSAACFEEVVTARSGRCAAARRRVSERVGTYPSIPSGNRMKVFTTPPPPSVDARVTRSGRRDAATNRRAPRENRWSRAAPRPATMFTLSIHIRTRTADHLDPVILTAAEFFRKRFLAMEVTGAMPTQSSKCPVSVFFSPLVGVRINVKRCPRSPRL